MGTAPPSSASSSSLPVCINVFETVSRTCLDYRFRIVTNKATLKRQESEHRVEEFILEFVQETLMSHLHEAEFEVLAVLEMDLFLVYRIRAVQGNTIFANVSQSFEQFRQTLDIFTADDVTTAVLPDGSVLGYAPLPLDNIAYLSYADNVAKPDCNVIIAMTDLQFCRMVLLSADQFEIKPSGVLITMDDRTFLPYEYIVREAEDGEKFVQRVSNGLEPITRRLIWLLTVCKFIYVFVL